jgi:hypothetical protein
VLPASSLVFVGQIGNLPPIGKSAYPSFYNLSRFDNLVALRTSRLIIGGRLPTCPTIATKVAQCGFAANGGTRLLVGRTIVFRGLPGKMTDDKKRSSVPLEIGAARKETKI